MTAPRPLRFEGRGGALLAADAWGPESAAPVVLLHGGGQTRHAWAGVGARLGADGWYAISVDLRGHGDSDWAPDGDYTVDGFVEDVVRVARALPRRPALVGASLGGLASLLAVGESDEPVASALVLVDIATRLEPSGVERIMDFMHARPEGFASLAEAADAVAEYLPHRERPRDLEGLRKNLREGEDGRLRWHWDPRFLEINQTSRRRNWSSDRLDRAAAALTVPTLLVRGRMSDILTEEGARIFLDLVPHARYVDVRDAGHMVAGDRNDRFSEAVLRFLGDELA